MPITLLWLLLLAPAGILHLAALNTHVSAILDMSAAKSAAPGWHLPRGTSAAVTNTADGATIAGISSFAFQGTNAHALLQQQTAAPVAVPSGAALGLWIKQRMWVAPPAHILLQTAAATGSGRGFARRQAASAVVALEAGLNAPQLAFLWQHMVLGVAVFPATAFLEMATGASRQLMNSNDLAGAALRSVVFATPLALPPAAGAPVRVRCLVQAAAGSFEVGSAVGAAVQYRTYFFASLAAASEAAASAGNTGKPVSLAAALLRSSLTAPARLAVAEVAVPQQQLGMSVHPAASEAAMHVAAAHQLRQRALRVAARIEAVHVPLPLPEQQQVWASSLVVAAAGAAAASGGSSSSSGQQEQQLVGSAGLSMRMDGMETRRLVAQVRQALSCSLVLHAP